MKVAEKVSQIHTRIIALLVLNLLVWVVGLVRNQSANTDGIADNVVEQLKNLAQVPTADNAANPTPVAGATANETIKNTVANIHKSAYVQGKKNTRYTLLEYSDLECPFCKRHFQNGTVEALIEKYPNDINHVFRHFPLTSIHPNAQLASEAIECAAEAKWSDTFYKLIEEIFNLPSLSRDAIVGAARSIGISETSMTACLDSGKFSNKVNEQLNEGQSLFGIRWTPGNVIVDNETGRFVAIPGAYPIDKFVMELENLMANE